MNFANSEGCRRCQTPFVDMQAMAPMPLNNYPPPNNYLPPNNYPPPGNFPPAPPINYAPSGGPYNNSYMPYQPAPGVYVDPANQLYGIGGWLILPAIGLVLSPLMMIYTIIQGMVGMSQLQKIDSSGMSIPTGDMRTLIVVEILGNSLLLIFVLVVALAFFGKSKLAPGLFMTFLLAYLIFAAVDYLVAQSAVNGFITALSAETGDKSVLKELDSINLESIQQISRATLSCAIWIPYFQKSKRVKATFVR